MKSNPFPHKCYSLAILVLAIILCSLTTTAQEKNESIWHPEAIYIVWPDMKLEIKLPNEKDSSGVANLLFRESASGKIYLLDSVKNNPHYQSNIFAWRSVSNIKDARYYTPFEKGKYDIILLYNCGKYIRYENILFKKDANKVIDLREEPLHLADMESQNWIGLRKYNTIIGERTLPKDSTTSSDKKISGYLFDQQSREAFPGVTIAYHTENTKVKSVNSAYDGYFEMDVNDKDIKPTLEINFIGFEAKKIDVKANTSYFIVLKPVVLSEKELRNIKTSPLIKNK